MSSKKSDIFLFFIRNIVFGVVLYYIHTENKLCIYYDDFFKIILYNLRKGIYGKEAII